jgi:hypothetical protein
VWGSLAHDYLVIMSLSVLSKRAFSQGGITIMKLRSCLKGDIVEALQCLKCAIKNDILLLEPAPSSMLEEEGYELIDGDADTDDYALDKLIIDEDDDF